MNTKEIYKKETGLEVNGKKVGIETVISAHYVDWLEQQFYLNGVVKSFTAEQILEELEDEENIYDARKYFKSLL